jgi:hypothetical protein
LAALLSGNEKFFRVLSTARMEEPSAATVMLQPGELVEPESVIVAPALAGVLTW